MSLGVSVLTSETPQSAGLSTSTGTAFVVAPASYGPEVPTLVRSLAEAIGLFGPRSEAESLKLYDALSTFFALGGARAYVQRIGTAAGVAAKLELEDSAKAKVVTVTAKYKGTLGNSIKLEVKENGAKFQLIILNGEGEVLEASPEFEKASELITWGKSHEAYVVISGAGSANKLEKLVATKLATGANPTVNEGSTIAAIENLPKALGPGTLIVPGNTEEKVHTAMAEHCQKLNHIRFAWGDLADSNKAATLIAGKGAVANAIAGDIAFASSTAIVAGLTLGTTRTVPGSAVVAGLCAQVAKTGNDNQAPAGEQWPLSPYVIGFTNTFNQADMETLNNAGINAFAEVNGVPCLFGFSTALSKEVDAIFWQASASRERMHLVWQAGIIGGKFLFKTIDGRKQLLAKFKGELQAMIAEHFLANALFGEEAPEAGVVNVGEPINTLATMQAGELNAELQVRISPFAQSVTIRIVSVPISESLALAA